MEIPINTKKIKSDRDLLEKSKWLIGKSLKEILESIKDIDTKARVVTKGEVGYVIEKGFFGLDKNSKASPDITVLGVEIKTTPLKYNSSRTKLSVKEPLSLNMIDYNKEHLNKSIRDSYLYKKNKKILFILYIHDKKLERSEYIIKYVFLWEMDDEVISELEDDYKAIIKKIKDGKAHEIHQKDNKYLTLCPKHNGNYKDPNDRISKRSQPFSNVLAEKRAFRLKNKYLNIIISRSLKKKLEKGGWDVIN